MYRGIIFDLDGVICSTDQYHFQAWKYLADSLGIYFDEAIDQRLRGVSRMDSLNIILERSARMFTQAEREALAEKKNQRYRALLEGMTREDLAPEVKDTLLALRASGFKLAIGSSSKNAGMILERLGLGDFFDAVSDGNGLRRSKPDPEVFLRAAALIEECPEHCLVVEDAAAGIEAAVSGGFDSAGIGGAAAHPRATYRLERFDDLKQILLGAG